MSTLAEDVATLTATVESLNNQTTALLEQYLLLTGVMQQALLAISSGDSTFAIAAYQSAQSAASSLEQAIEKANSASMSATSAATSALELQRVSDKIFYWE
jgi:hypothetical protein